MSPRTRTALLTGCFFLAGLFAPASMLRPRAAEPGAAGAEAELASRAAPGPRAEAAQGPARPAVELAVLRR